MIKLEVGKKYVDKYGAVDTIKQEKEGFYFSEEGNCYRKNGEWVNKRCSEGCLASNLIAEHKEPVVQERWLVILKNAEGEEISLIHTEKQDTSRFNRLRLKFVNQQKITYTEE